MPAHGTAAGFLVAYPYGTTKPGTSDLNWAVALTAANSASVPSSGSGVSVYNNSTGSVQLIAAQGRPAPSIDNGPGGARVR